MNSSSCGGKTTTSRSSETTSGIANESLESGSSVSELEVVAGTRSFIASMDSVSSSAFLGAS